MSEGKLGPKVEMELKDFARDRNAIQTKTGSWPTGGLLLHYTSRTQFSPCMSKLL